MAKVTAIEVKPDKNGTQQKITTFDGGQKVWVSAKYNADIYESVTEGSEHPLHKQGNFWKIGEGESTPSAPSQKAVEIKVAQDNKEKSISWFNANNLAVQMLVGLNPNAADPHAYIREHRDIFLADWKAHKGDDGEIPF